MEGTMPKTAKDKRIDLTSGGMWKGIFRFSLPLMMSNTLQILFNMSDLAVVGHFSGARALGNVGSTSILVALITGFLIGIGAGINALIARHYGAGDHDAVSRGVHTSLIVAIAAGVTLLAIGQIFPRGLLILLNTKSELIDGAELYMRIYFLGMPALAIYDFGNGVLSAIGDTRKPLIFLSAAGVINVILNLFFVIVCKWDVAGVAAASVISQYISAGLIIRSLFRSKDSFALSFKKLAFHAEEARTVLSLGIPAGFQNAIFGISNLFIQAAVNSFDAVMVEGNAAAANADNLVYGVMGAFYVACTSFTAQNYGAGSRKRVSQSFGICLFFSFAVGSVFAGGVLLLGRQFLSIFTSETPVIDAGMKRLMIMGPSYAFSALMDTAISASRGLGKTLKPTIIVISGVCVFRVIWVYTVFAHFGTIPSLYLLYICSWFITGAAETIYYVRSYRRIFSDSLNNFGKLSQSNQL